MWFVGAQKTDDARAPYGYYERIGLATSPDGLNWTVANNDQPVLDLGQRGSVDAKGVSHPFVLHDGGVYRMWYSARWQSKSPTRWPITSSGRAVRIRGRSYRFSTSAPDVQH